MSHELSATAQMAPDMHSILYFLAHTQYITIKPRTDPICDDYHPGQIEHILMQMTGERFDPTISAGRARARIIDVISIEWKLY